jgi:hypothetical protein
MKKKYTKGDNVRRRNEKELREREIFLRRREEEEY